jgi:hypothetical protein
LVKQQLNCEMKTTCRVQSALAAAGGGLDAREMLVVFS